MIGVGEEFPEFHLNCVDTNNEIASASQIDLLGDWSVLYFYPKDFTFICPTEIQGFDNLVGDSCTVMGFSPDNEYVKLAWKRDNELIEDIMHDLVADSNNEVASELGIVSDEGVPYRATYIVDPDGIIQHVSVNALDTGRNCDEIYRTLEALQAGGLTGCSWQRGDEFVA